MSIEQVQYATEVASLVEEVLAPPTQGLKHAYENSTKHGIPMIAVSPSQGKLLSLLTRISKAKNVLELGALGGYSSIWFATALQSGQRHGKVTSIELDPMHRDVALGNLEVAGIKTPSEAEILLGAGLEVLPKLEQEIKSEQREPFDFIFIDADWDNQWPYFEWAVKVSSGSGSVIFIDNAVRQMFETGVVGPAKRDISVPDLVAKVGADDRVDAIVIQTVGKKDYDGFLLAIVK